MITMENENKLICMNFTLKNKAIQKNTLVETLYILLSYTMKSI